MNAESSCMIHQLHKYLIAATIAYQERYGQGAETENLLGADANKVLFRITASDAQELVSELKERRHIGEGENH